MTDIAVMEDMIEIENIKQEPEIKEEIDLSCSEELAYLSGEEVCNNDLGTSDLKNISTERRSLSIDQNKNQDNYLLMKNPFCDIQIANISYTRPTEASQSSNTKLKEPCPENAIDIILFQCDGCTKPIEGLADHTYTKPGNRLKEIVEYEERKEISDQVYACKFCPFLVISPQKYLLHLQMHESEVCSCRSCHEQLKVSDLLNIHMLIKFRTCKFCRKVFTHEKGYRQHLKTHYTVPTNSWPPKQNLDSEVQTLKFEEITIKEEDHEIDSDAETSMKNEEIAPSIEDNENVLEEPETSMNDKKIQRDLEYIESGTKGLESYQSSFLKDVKSWKNSERENNISKNILTKGNLPENKESLVKNERNQDPPQTLPNEEIQELHVVKNSIKEGIPCNKVEKVIFLFECTGCARNFVNKKAILEHVTKKHTEEFRLWETLYVKKKLADKKPKETMNVNEEGKYTCRFCPVKFNTTSQYLNHLKVHHVCNYCNKTFSSQQLLEDHKCEFPKSLVCHICDKPFVFRNNYIAHLNSHENDCEICKEQFTSESMLTIHKKSVHPEGICYVCHRWFSSEKLLEEHRRKVHDISIMSFFCYICQKNIRSEKKFRAHMEDHGEKRPFSCSHCGKFYARYLAMKAHSERCDLFDERKVFECDICKKAFYNKKKFVPHFKQHYENGEMPPIEELSVEDQKILSFIKSMKNSKKLKDIKNLKINKDSNSETSLNEMPSPLPLNSDNNLKRLSFGPKIVWRVSSLQSTTLFSKLEQKRERERQRKHKRQDNTKQLRTLFNPPQNTYLKESKVLDSNIKSTFKRKLYEEVSPVKVQNRSLLKPKILGNSRMKFERSERIDPVEIKQSQKNRLLVTRKRPARQSFSEEPIEKLLILGPITKVTGQCKIEKIGKQNVKRIVVRNNPSLQIETKEDDSILINLPPVKSECDPLDLENAPIDSAIGMINSLSNDESDPLALENPPMDSETRITNSLLKSDESDPLALENPPMDSTAKVDSEIIIDSVTSSSEKPPMTCSNKSVSKLRSIRRKNFSANKPIEQSKPNLQKKKEDSQNKIRNNKDFFFCTICKKRILSCLKNEHMKIHDEGLKKFECTVCKKKFNTYVGKMRHEKSHTKK